LLTEQVINGACKLKVLNSMALVDGASNKWCIK